MHFRQGSAVPSPPSSWVSGRTAAAVNIKAGRGGGIGGSGISPMPHAVGVLPQSYIPQCQCPIYILRHHLLSYGFAK